MWERLPSRTMKFKYEGPYMAPTVGFTTLDQLHDSNIVECVVGLKM